MSQFSSSRTLILKPPGCRNAFGKYRAPADASFVDESQCLGIDSRQALAVKVTFLLCSMYFLAENQGKMHGFDSEKGMPVSQYEKFVAF